MMNRYEIALVLNALIDDEARTAVLEKVKEYVARFGGELSDVDVWGKRRLAYEIQKMKEGYYYFIHFTADPTVPAQLEPRLRIMDNVLRYLIVSQDEDDNRTFGNNGETEETAEAEATAEVTEAAAETVEPAVEETASEEPAEAAEPAEGEAEGSSDQEDVSTSEVQ